MALVLLTEPTPTSPPSRAADWGYAMSKQTAALQAFTGRSIVDGSTIHAGTVILVGNSLYKSVTDTTISGTPSLYVKITHSGASATADFVSSLAGVSWNFVTGQYVDGSGNVYLFDEAKAINEGVLSTARTMQGQITHMAGALDINGALTGVTSLAMGGPLTGVTSIGMNGNMSGPGSFSTKRFVGGGTRVLEEIDIGATRVYRSVMGPGTLQFGTGDTYDYFIIIKPASGGAFTAAVETGFSVPGNTVIYEPTDVGGTQIYVVYTRTT